MRPIDADALFYKLVNTDPNTNGKFCEGVVTAMEFVLKASTLDPAQLVPQGEWKYDEVEMEYFCSVCGHNAPIGMSSYIRHDYCPNCGARMWKEKDDA